MILHPAYSVIRWIIHDNCSDVHILTTARCGADALQVPFTY